MKRYFTALYPYNATDFWSQGYGVISDALSSVTTESANSNGSISYQLEMTYPKNGPLASKLVEGNLIRCAESSDPNKFMIFEIVESNKADTGNLTIYGEAYPNRVRRMTFKNGGKFKTFNSPQEAINAGIGQIDGWPADFVVTCEVSGKLDFRDEQGNPTIFEDFGAFLDAINDAIHGEVEYTAWNRVRIYSKRGRDRKDEIQLRDDKNISGVTVKTDHSSIINVIVPLIPIKDAEGNPTAETKVGKAVKSAKPFEFINYYAGKVVQVDTQELANSYFNRTHADRPSVTVDVDPEVNEANLTSLQLFDTVTLYSKSLGYSTTIRVAQRDFDNLTGRVSHFSLGSSGSSIFTSSSSEIEQLKQQVTAAQNAGQVALVTADGKNQFFPESTDPPQNPREGDIWFKRDGDVVRLMQFHNGDWVEQVSDTTGKEIADALDKIADDAAKSKKKAIEAEEKAQKAVEGFEGLDESIKEAEAAANESIKEAEAAANESIKEAEAAANEAKSQAAQSVESSKKAASDAAIAINNAKDALTAANGASKTVQSLQTSVDTINGQLVNTASKTDVNSLSQTVKDQSTKVSQNTAAIKNSATKSEVNALTGRVKTSETLLNQTAEGLKGKASSTDLNKVSGELSTLTTKFNTTSSGFQASLSKIDDKVNSNKEETDSALQVAKADIKATADNLSTNYTKTTDEHNYVNSQIIQSADKINLSVASVSDKVDNLSYDNRNLLSNLDDAFIQGSYYGENRDRIHLAKPFTLLPERTYTLSWVPSESVSWNLAFVGLDSDGKVTVDTGWSDKTITTTFSENTVALQINIRSSKDAAITPKDHPQIKLEKGTKATDYTPAPEDLATVTALSKVDQKADSISTTVTNNKKDADSKFTNVNQTISGIQSTVANKADASQITQLSNQINLKVSQADFDNLQVGGRNYLLGTANPITLVGDGKHKVRETYQVSDKEAIRGKGIVFSFNISKTEGTNDEEIMVLVGGTNQWITTVSLADIPVNASKRVIIYRTVFDKEIRGDIGFETVSDSFNGSVTVSNVQLELGTKATDWSPAPEDTDSKIAALQIDADGIKQTVSNKADTSYVDQKANSLTSTILNNKNDANKQFTTINQTLKGVQTVVKNAATKAELTTLSNVVSSKVSQSDLTKKVVKQNWVEDGSSRTSLYHGQKSATGKVAKSLAGPYTSIDFGASNLLSVKIGSLADADYIVELDIVSALSMNILVSDGPGGSGISGGKLSPNTTRHVKIFVPNLSLGTELIIMGDAGGKTFKVTNIKISERAKNEPIPPLVTFMGNIVSFPLRTSMKTKLVAGRQYTLEFDALSETTKNTALNLKTMKSNGKLSAVIKKFTPVEAGINPKHFKYTGTNWGAGWQDIILAEATTDVSKMNTFTVTNVYFYEGATQESTEQLITYSQYIQTQNALSLAVRKDDIVNRLNLSEEGLLIDAKKVQITGDTYIEKAAITSAMIKSLKADKITAGTIDASKINVINLNASRITTGTLTGVEIIQKTGERGTHLDYQGVGFYQNNTKVGRIATSEAKGYGGYYKVEYHAKNELTLAVDTEPSNRDGAPSIQLYSRGAAGSAVSISAGITMISGKANIGGMSVTPTQVDFGYTKIASGTDGLSFRPIKFNNINYPALSNYKKNAAGFLFGSSNLYLVVNGKVTDLAGVKLPTSIASDGTVNHWRLVG